MADKYSALWVSHTSISDFLKCPRAYFLKNIYKDPKTGHKLKIMGPSLALGQAVHEVLESLSMLPTDKRFQRPLLELFDESWKKVSGKKGGFTDPDTEYKYKSRGQSMISRCINAPGILKKPAVKIKEKLPYFWLSEEDNIILCGKIDWLEYLPDTDTVHIVDFKTGKNQESVDSLQLPIYHLLVTRCQKRSVSKASYWYLESCDSLEEKVLPDEKESSEKILKVAKQIKLARSLERFKCPHNGCRACKDFEAILNNKAEYVGVDGYNYDVYILDRDKVVSEEDSVIL